MPTGSEGGANDFWLPGGITSGDKIEAVLDNVPIPHNNNISNLSNAKPILEY